MSDAIHIHHEGPLCWITLNRPKANAIDCQTSQQIYEALCNFETNPALRVAILTGAGQRFFSAGWDLKAAAQGEAVDANHGPGGFGGVTEYFSRKKPLIAAVNGMAVGGGFEVALACDLIIAAEHAQFFLPEVQIGIIPDSGGLFRLSRRLPRAIALDMILSGRRMNAAEAQQWGIINQVVPADALADTARALAQRLIACAPLAQGAVLELLQATETLSLPDAFHAQHQADLPQYRRMLQSRDAQEGIQAFADGRDPIWTGH